MSKTSLATKAKTQKAEISPVPVGPVAIEGLLAEDGKFYVGVPQIAETFNIPIVHASRDVKKLLTKNSRFFKSGVEFTKLKTSFNRNAINAIPHEWMEVVIHELALKGNLAAREFLTGRKTDSRKFCKPEKRVQVALHQRLGGDMEVLCLAGKIDLLTNEEIIEVKPVRHWKSAVGQILIYGFYYPSHRKRIHLFGETQESYLSMICSHCERFQISVTWQKL